MKQLNQEGLGVSRQRNRPRPAIEEVTGVRRQVERTKRQGQPRIRRADCQPKEG